METPIIIIVSALTAYWLYDTCRDILITCLEKRGYREEIVVGDHWVYVFLEKDNKLYTIREALIREILK